MYLSTRIVTEAKSYACSDVSKLSISNGTVSNAQEVGFRYGYSMKWYYAFSVLFLRQAIQFPVPLSYTFTLYSLAASNLLLAACLLVYFGTNFVSSVFATSSSFSTKMIST